MKLQRLMIDFAPDARPMDPRLVWLESHFLPLAAAAVAAYALIVLLRGYA